MATLRLLKVSIVIPAFNEEKLIQATLASIDAARAALTGRGWESEVIVCDNNSTDRTADRARAAGARVVPEPINQISRARNRGAAEARGDWLLFIDADSRPSRELLNDLADRIQEGTWIGGGSLVRLEEPLHWFWRFWVGLWNQLSLRGRWPAGSFFAVETRAFRQVGGFSTSLYISEELDLAKRLKQLGTSQGRRLFILHRHPLVTSARKLHLYNRREVARTVFQSILRRAKFTTNRDACHIWYDGRR